jgi:RNA polymerase sigma-70 factor, ECF subfamily
VNQGLPAGVIHHSPRADQDGTVDLAEDSSLVRSAQAGCLPAYEELAARHAGRAYRTALRMLGNHHDAQDVAQEALVAAWHGLVEFRADASFTTWLHRIVTTRCLNKINRSRQACPLEAVPEVADSGGGPAEQAERTAAANAVATAITELPVSQRTALVLRLYEGMSYADIAAFTHSTVPAVRSHLHRARLSLATTLRGWE